MVLLLVNVFHFILGLKSKFHAIPLNIYIVFSQLKLRDWKFFKIRPFFKEIGIGLGNKEKMKQTTLYQFLKFCTMTWKEVGYIKRKINKALFSFIVNYLHLKWPKISQKSHSRADNPKTSTATTFFSLKMFLLSYAMICKKLETVRYVLNMPFI